jgi:hypothetical protein
MSLLGTTHSAPTPHAPPPRVSVTGVTPSAPHAPRLLFRARAVLRRQLLPRAGPARPASDSPCPYLLHAPLVRPCPVDHDYRRDSPRRRSQTTSSPSGLGWPWPPAPWCGGRLGRPQILARSTSKSRRRQTPSGSRHTFFYFGHRGYADGNVVGRAVDDR